MRARLVAFVSSVVALSGCGRAPPAAPVSPSPAAPVSPSSAAPVSSSPSSAARLSSSAALAPFPYTPEQIRASCVPGHSLTFRVELAGQPTTRATFRFVEQTAETAVTEEGVTDEAGAVIEAPHRETATWIELQAHASFPAAQTTITQGVAKTPVGDFPAHVYRVSRGAKVSTFYFADAMPGPPVLFFTDEEGKRVMTSTLVALERGGS